MSDDDAMTLYVGERVLVASTANTEGYAGVVSSVRRVGRNRTAVFVRPDGMNPSGRPWAIRYAPARRVEREAKRPTTGG